jgi:NADH:ubiquinone oxidoreductase subunit D
VPAEFEGALREIINIFPKRIDQYEALLTKNPLFMSRTKGIGVLSSKDALAWDVTGPTLRSTGIAHDIRKSNPYCGYDQYDFDIPTQTTGDFMAVIRSGWKRCANLFASWNRRWINCPTARCATTTENMCLRRGQRLA